MSLSSHDHHRLQCPIFEAELISNLEAVSTSAYFNYSILFSVFIFFFFIFFLGIEAFINKRQVKNKTCLEKSSLTCQYEIKNLLSSRSLHVKPLKYVGVHSRYFTSTTLRSFATLLCTLQKRLHISAIKIQQQPIFQRNSPKD